MAARPLQMIHAERSILCCVFVEFEASFWLLVELLGELNGNEIKGHHKCKGLAYEKHFMKTDVFLK